MITKERLHELFIYNPEAGTFTRKTNHYKAKAGAVAGYTCPRGYVQISVDGIGYRAHRLAFLYMEGRLPKLIDHVDRNKSNNRWKNLRETAHIFNSMNQGCKGRSTTGVRNVRFNPLRSTYEVRLRAMGLNIFIGSYGDLEAAELVAQLAREKYFKEFS